jgi:peroxiredoxin
MLMVSLRASPLRAAAVVVPGQELNYAGTLTLKQSSQGRAAFELSGPLKLSATVTEADASRGYSFILLRQFNPGRKAGQPQSPADSGVVMLRFNSELVPTGPQNGPGGMLDALTQLLTKLPTATSGQKVPSPWHRSEPLPFLPPQPLDLVYCVIGEGKPDDHPCQTIEKKLATALPFRLGQGAAALEVTDFRQTLCVDPNTGLVLSNSLQETLHLINGERTTTLEFAATASLQDIHQFSAAELSARLSQARVIEQAQDALSSLAPRAHRQAELSRAAQTLASVRQNYPNSPFAATLGQLGQELEAARSQVGREAQLEALAGKPAPAFVLASLSGQKHKLADYRGKIVVLSFLTSWSGLCDQQAALLEKEFWQKYRKRGVVVIGVDAGEREAPAQKAQQFRNRHGLTYPILVDHGNQVLRRYRVLAFPTSVVIDRKGTVRLTQTGFHPADLAAVVGRLTSQSKR